MSHPKIVVFQQKKVTSTQSGDLHGDSQAKAAIFSDVLAQHGDFQTTGLQFELSTTCDETKDETSERFCRQELKSIERLERAPERNLSAGAQGGEPGEQ